jgi:integration host factor subunit beta
MAMHGTVTKSELIERISEKLKLPNGKAEQIVNCVFDSMVKALQEGEGIEIRGFGSFTVREYKAYEGRNPRTGETVHVAPKKLPFFKVGKDLRERVNSAFLGGNAVSSSDSDDDDDDDDVDDEDAALYTDSESDD